MNGEITVQSEVGKGSSFIFKIKIKPEEESKLNSNNLLMVP